MPTLISAGPIALGLGLFLIWPTRDLPVELLAIDIAVALALAAAALVLSQEPGQGGTARLLSLGAATWLVNLTSIGAAGPLPWSAWVVSPLFWGLLGWALLRYPGQRLETASQGWLILAVMFWVGPVHLATGFVLDPDRLPRYFPPGVWWPSLFPGQDLYAAARLVYYLGAAVLAVAFLVVALRRWLALQAVDRWLGAPLAASVVAVVVPAASWFLGPFLSERTTRLAVGVTQTAILPLVPFAFLLVALRRRLIRTSIAEVVLQLTTPATTGSVRDALRLALRDPRLHVFVWVPGSGYVDDRGEPADVAEAQSSGYVHEVRGPDGEPLAAVVADATLAVHGDLVDVAAAASAHALQNARLHAVLRRELTEVAASRRRLVETAVAQRRSLERDLHDGVQQRLLALALTLAAARDAGDGGRLAELLDQVRADLHETLEEVRSLAQGIHPAILSQGGLRAALEDVVERLPLPIRLDVPARRFPSVVESTAYYIVCEALSNVVKHSGAGHAEVRLLESDGALVIDVTDNGVGVVDPIGNGIGGLRDRAAALGGRLQVEAVASGGTVVKAVIPCE